MTKTVRIENADSGTDKKLVVEIYQVAAASGLEDTLMKTLYLTNPTDLVTEVVYDGMYIVIHEESQ